MDGAMDVLATIILILVLLPIIMMLVAYLWPLVIIMGIIFFLTSGTFAEWEWIGQLIATAFGVLWLIGCVLELIERK